MPQRPSPTAVIVTALEVETRAVLRQLGKCNVETVGGTGFFKGEFEGWDIAVVEAGPGNAGAAAIAVRALEHYKPHVALFVGVAGGVKDVAIGDVVVATKVYGYESARIPPRASSRDRTSRSRPMRWISAPALSAKKTTGSRGLILRSDTETPHPSSRRSRQARKSWLRRRPPPRR